MNNRPSKEQAEERAFRFAVPWPADKDIQRVLWLQRSQSFIDFAPNNYLALRRSAMYW